MKCKLSFLLLVCLASLLLVNITSAITIGDFIITAPANTSHDIGSLTMTFVLNNTGANGTVNLTNSITSGSYTVSFSQSNPISLNANQSTAVTATLVFPKYQTGNLAGTITANPSGAGSIKSALFSIQILSSSSLSTTKLREISATQNGSINITNTGNTVLSEVNMTSSGSFEALLYDSSGSRITSPFLLAVGESKIIALAPATSYENLKFGANAITLSAKDSLKNAIANSQTFAIDKSSCKFGQAATNLTFAGITIKSTGEDDEIWKPLDKITIEAKVENSNEDGSIREVFAEIGLYDETGKNVIRKLDFENGDSSDEYKYDLGSIKEGEYEKATFTFTIPADFEDGDYKFGIKAYSKREGEAKICVDESDDLSKTFYQEISIVKEDDEGKYIAFSNIELTPTEVICGETLTITLDVVNVGEDEQDQVKVNLRVKDLGIELFREIKSNLDAGDKESITFTFNVPQTLIARTTPYTLEIEAEYDYKNGVYKKSSEDITKLPLEILGCKQPVSPSVAGISAVLESAEAKAGGPVVIKSTISNLLSTEQSFVITAKNYETWATLNSISDRILTLRPGETKDIRITLDVKKDASGDKSFTLEARAGEQVQTKEIALSITGKSSLFDLNNSVLWVIGAINLVLIVLIIIVAVKLSSR